MPYQLSIRSLTLLATVAAVLAWSEARSGLVSTTWNSALSLGTGEILIIVVFLATAWLVAKALTPIPTNLPDD